VLRAARGSESVAVTMPRMGSKSDAPARWRAAVTLLAVGINDDHVQCLAL
jgi:hypothetical protein